MARYNTNNPVPSNEVRDFSDNAQIVDEIVHLQQATTKDRFGNDLKTWYGISEDAKQAIINIGWNPVGTFQDGATITGAGDILQDESTGVWYRWDDLSTLPKTVDPDSTPDSTGGTGEGKWLAVDVNDVLRKELAEPMGAELVGAIDSDGNETTVQEAMNHYREMTIKDRLDVTLTTSAMGALGNGVDDDTDAIQLAIDTLATMTKRATLYIDGRSPVSSLTIPATLSLSVEGNNLGGSSYNRSALIGTSTTTPVFNCLGSACSFTNIQFVGASNDVAGGGDTTQTAILFNPGVANSYNCDAVVSGCGFVFFNKIFDLRGRNLKIVNCVLSNSAFAVWIGTTGIPDFRGLDIKGVRFHYMSASAGTYSNPKQAAGIFIDGATQFSTVNISGCLGDGCKWMFVGSFPWGAITNNEFTAQQTGLFFQDTTGSTLGSALQKTALCNNTVNGTYITAGQSSSMIHISNGWGVDIDNNVINNASGRGVYNLAAGSTISNNVIKNPSFIDSGYACIETSGANSVVSNNICINTGQGNGTPGKAIKLNNFTYVDGNTFSSGYTGNEWDTSARGNTLIYGRMDVSALPSVEWGTAAPTSGRYLQGSVLYNTNVLAGGTLGWVCVSSGTPGTWKGFGGVAP
jgi:hypothetical protein